MHAIEIWFGCVINFCVVLLFWGYFLKLFLLCSVLCMLLKSSFVVLFLHGVAILRIISRIIFALLCVMHAMVILELFGLISEII